MIALAHVMLAELLFGWNVTGGLTTVLEDNKGVAFLTFAGLVILAYMLGPLTPVCGAILDGSILPEWLHNWLRNDRRSDWAALNESMVAANRKHLEMHDFRNEWIDLLDVAAQKGIAAGTITNPNAITDAKVAVDEITGNTVPSADDAKKTAQFLATALERNSSQLRDDEDSNSLDNLLRRFLESMDQWVAEATHQVYAAQARLGTNDEQHIQPTRFGDARFLLERHSRAAYHAPLTYLWPRVKLAIPDGDADGATGVPRMVSDSMAQVDFAVLLFALWWTIPLAWLPLIAFTAKSVWALLAIGWFTPYVGKALYELAIQAELIAGGAIATVIDRYHRDALKNLGFDPPIALSAERNLWTRLDQSRNVNNQEELIYAKSAGVAG